MRPRRRRRRRSAERVDLTGVDVVLNPDFGDGLLRPRSAAALARGAATTRPASSCCSATSPGSRPATVRAAGRRRAGHAIGVCALRRRARVTRSGSIGSMFATLSGLHGDKAVWKMRRVPDAATSVHGAAVARRRCRATWTPGRTTRRCSRSRRMERRCPDLVPSEVPAAASTSTTTSPTTALATAVFLALELGLPLLLEGEPGVGKTAAAKALAGGARRAADPAAVLRGPHRQRGALRVELPAPAAGDPAGRVAARAARARPTCSPRSSSSSGRSCAASGTTGRGRRCCSSTRSTGPTTSSRRCCWSSSARAR